MIQKTLITALVAACLALPALAFADEHERDRDRDRHDEQAQERGAEHHHYHKGERLSVVDHRSEYVVNDWHERNLREPPPGHHWVRSGDDYVLAAIATGIVADIALNH